MANDDEVSEYRSGPLWMMVGGLAIALVSFIGTIVLINDLGELGLEGSDWSHEAWRLVIAGLAPFGVGIAIASLGMVLGRLDERAGRTRLLAAQREVLRGLAEPPADVP